MPQYEINALNGLIDDTYEAETSQEAEKQAREDLIEQFRHTVSVNKIDVYEIRLEYGKVTVGVPARSPAEAEDIGRDFVENQRQDALDQVDHGTPAHTLLVDLNTAVTVEGKAGRDSYEVNRDGHWEEGEL